MKGEDDQLVEVCRCNYQGGLARHRPVLNNFATKCGREGILQHSLFKTDQVFSQVLLEEQKSGIPARI